MRLEDAEPGSVVFIDALKLKGTVIGYRKGYGESYHYIGFNSINDNCIFIDCVLKVKDLIYRNAKSDIIYPEAYDYKFAYAASMNRACVLITSSNRIVYKKQACIECQLTAPHAKSNLPENKFICSTCKFIKELV